MSDVSYIPDVVARSTELEPTRLDHRIERSGSGAGSLGRRGCRDQARREERNHQRGQARAVSRTYVAARHRSVVRLAPAKPSFGQLAGLHSTSDDLDLKSSVALVIDQDKNEVLLSKNDSAVLPIASITKLMTGLVLSEAKLPMDEQITITQDDVD